MKITRTIGLVSAAMMGMGLLSSCAHNREHQTHHSHHHPHHHNVPHQQNDVKHPVQQKAKTAAKRTAMSFNDVVAKARTGDADAQYALGYMYYYGQDVERNNEKARYWIEKSANQGQENAITALRLLGKSNNQIASNNNESASEARTNREAQGTHPNVGSNRFNQNSQANRSAQNEGQRYNQQGEANRYTRNEGQQNNQQAQSNEFARNESQQVNQQAQPNQFARNEDQQNNQQRQGNRYARNKTQQFNHQYQLNQHEGQRFNRQSQSNWQAQNEGRRNSQQSQANRYAQQDEQAINQQSPANQSARNDEQSNRNAQNEGQRRNLSAQDNQFAQQPAQRAEAPNDRNVQQNMAANTDASADRQAPNAQAQLAQSEDKGLAVALNKVNANPAQLTAHEKSLIDLPSHHYTLQLYGARKLDLAEGIIAKNNLGDHAKIYHTQFQNKDWYVLVYGNYSSSAEAIRAISKLPPAVQKLKPWAKPVASVKEGIRASLPAAPVS